MQADRAGLEAERGALAALMQRIQLDSAASPDGPSPYRRLLGFPSILRNQAASELLGSLAVLENERSALLRRRTWIDPDVQSLTARIDDLDAQLKGIATTYLEGLTSQVAGLDQAGRQFGRAMDSLPQVEIQTARLQREATILEELYATMTTRLKEAEIVRAVQDPAVRVVDRAFPAERPLRPKPALNLALSLILGSMLGLGLSLGREMLRQVGTLPGRRAGRGRAPGAGGDPPGGSAGIRGAVVAAAAAARGHSGRAQLGNHAARTVPSGPGGTGPPPASRRCWSPGPASRPRTSNRSISSSPTWRWPIASARSRWWCSPARCRGRGRRSRRSTSP